MQIGQAGQTITDIDQMPMIRVFFSKTSRAKYTSHLDTMRTMQRALKRSGLPVWYTMGFNPHMYMTFALPIALGYESMCESVDIRLTKDIAFDDIVKQLNKALPPGIVATKAQTPKQDPQVITWGDYDIRLIYDNIAMQAVMAMLESFLKLGAIDVTKKTKKGEKVVDIKPLSNVLSQSFTEREVNITLRIASGNVLNINPTLWLKAFYDFAELEPDGAKITRTRILDKNFNDFE